MFSEISGLENPVSVQPEKNMCRLRDLCFCLFGMPTNRVNPLPKLVGEERGWASNIRSFRGKTFLKILIQNGKLSASFSRSLCLCSIIHQLTHSGGDQSESVLHDAGAFAGPAQANDLLRRLQTGARKIHADEYFREGLLGGKFNRRC